MADLQKGDVVYFADMGVFLCAEVQSVRVQVIDGESQEPQVLVSSTFAASNGTWINQSDTFPSASDLVASAKAAALAKVSAKYDDSPTIYDTRYPDGVAPE